MSTKKHHHKKEHDVESVEKMLEEMSKIAEERLNQIQYLRADFDNYKKNLDKQQSEFESQANQRLVKDLLPFIDDLEAATKKAENKENCEGYTLLLKKLLDVLFKHGFKHIESVGKICDPYYHDVMLSVESDLPDGTVIEELQKGYFLHSTVIRHAKVKVAKNKKHKEK
ncbi:MAG: nucleotide exchange factor GrpE [Candidatus Aenigmarchaeota archaeon]|nr:nucleotide exchange factor GrpE [Candidatus Aenigmarchaeota archaeon]